ncbi:hypothetical protein [Ruminococcus sp. HUN007]|uniref:flagellin n=1 Tax=Ruminococcus sp. HUN007 TaxID=1514668 RepID=UPI0005D2482A|nr:hypothetical protein [Ruminococcus sp. HUN007]
MDYECEYGYDAEKVGFDEVLNLFNMNEKQFLDQFGSGNDDVDNWRNGIFWITDCSHKGFKGTLQDSTSVEGGDKLKPVNPAVIQNMPTSTQIQNDPENYYYEDNPVKYSGDSYVDIGLDISVAGNGKVAPKTAFKTTVDGIAAMGYGSTTIPYDEIKGLQAKAGATGTNNGQDRENVSNNLYDMMTQMQDAINSIKEDENGNSNIADVIDKISAVMVNFQKQTDKVIAAESELGVRSKFLETNLDRLEQENTSLKKMQKDIEGVDDATEITNFLGYQNAWNLVLQFGKNIVPKSLMDYVN